MLFQLFIYFEVFVFYTNMIINIDSLNIWIFFKKKIDRTLVDYIWYTQCWTEPNLSNIGWFWWSQTCQFTRALQLEKCTCFKYVADQQDCMNLIEADSNHSYGTSAEPKSKPMNTIFCIIKVPKTQPKEHRFTLNFYVFLMHIQSSVPPSPLCNVIM